VERETAIAGVGHAIQLSVAPVFLLSGIGAMLAVMTNRLTRVVDLARAVEARLVTATANDSPALHGALTAFSRRANLINRAITLFTLAALFVCAVIGTLFVGAFLRVDASIAIAVLFVAAMTSFIAALMFFLREIFIATANLRIGPR
jgi:hypothetical protein